MDKVFISETSTSTVPNTSCTAANVSSDTNGMAVMDACHKLQERINPYKLKNPEHSWEQWVSSAYHDGISLSVTGFYQAEGADYVYKDDHVVGTPFLYFSYGAACSEVEVDCLTGDHTILRTDIVMDLGQSLIYLY